MSRIIFRRSIAVLAALGLTVAMTVPAQAAGGWTTPAALPAGVGSGPLAMNASGAQVAVVSGPGIQVSSSAAGPSWTTPVTVSSGGSGAAIALSADGRAVVVWDNGTVLQSSAMAPGGAWSAPVTVGTLTAGARPPLVAMDASGNAIVAWAGSAGAKEKGPVYSASLPAGGSWTPVSELEPASVAGSVIRLALNPAGAAIVSWSEQDSVVADSGTILGGFGTPVTVGTALQYEDVPKTTSIAINNAGQAAIVYDVQGNIGQAATRTAAGTWSAPAGLGCSFAGDAAIDGTGDALALCEGSNAEGQETFDATRLTAGGTWSAPQVLSTDEIVSLTAAASNAGTFVVALQDLTAGALTVLTSAPGSGFGTPASFPGYGLSGLTMTPAGHATLILSGSGGDSESAEPAS